MFGANAMARPLLKRIVRPLPKGQITIPQEYRIRFGLLPNTEVEFIAEKTAHRSALTPLI